MFFSENSVLKYVWLLSIQEQVMMVQVGYLKVKNCNTYICDMYLHVLIISNRHSKFNLLTKLDTNFTYRLNSLKFCGMELNFRSVIDKVGPCRCELAYKLESFGRQTSQFSAGPRRRRFSKIQR